MIIDERSDVLELLRNDIARIIGLNRGVSKMGYEEREDKILHPSIIGEF